MACAAYAVEHAIFKTSPIKHVHAIKAPVLFAGANKDTLCPMDVIKKAAALTPNAELYAADCDHFELFTPQHMPGLQAKQLEFLLKHVGLPSAEEQAAAAAAAAKQEEMEAPEVATS